MVLWQNHVSVPIARERQGSRRRRSVTEYDIGNTRVIRVSQIAEKAAKEFAI